MNFKNTKAEITTVTRDLHELENKCGNIYDACNIISNRANQLSTDLRIELTEKLQEFSVSEDINDEYQINGEQIEVSQYYESLPKPNAIAIDEYLNDDLFFRYEDKATPSTESKEV